MRNDPTSGRELMRATWARLAADLTAELGVPVRWCLLGLEIPDGHGGCGGHTSDPQKIRDIVPHGSKR